MKNGKTIEIVQESRITHDIILLENLFGKLSISLFCIIESHIIW